LSTAIEGFNLAKEVVNIAPAKAAFGSVSIILTMIRVRCSCSPSSLSTLKHAQDSRLNEEEYVKLGIACAEVCIALSRGMNGKRLEDLNQSVSEAIVQLTT
jgi:hypothetical protein